MAERRMFTKKITDSDAFLDMPASAQALYFHLNMHADDDGFVNSPKSIQRTVGATSDDIKILLLKRFILAFESGVIVIKHWKMHNYIQSDRYKSTDYIEERSQLMLDDKKAYTMNVSNLDTECIQDVSIGEDRIGKDRIGKVRLGYKESDRSEYYPNDEILDSCFKDFIAMRKKMRSPMTDKAIDLAMKKLADLSGGDNNKAIDIINQSIMNGWKSFYELKSQKQSNESIDWSKV